MSGISQQLQAKEFEGRDRVVAADLIWCGGWLAGQPPSPCGFTNIVKGWATWRIADLPEILRQGLQKFKYEGRGVQIVHIPSWGDDTASAVRED